MDRNGFNTLLIYFKGYPKIKNSKWGTKIILDVVDGYMDGAKPKPKPISPNAKKIVV